MKDAREAGPSPSAGRGPGLERAHGGCRRRPDPDRAHRAQPGQARPSLSCHRTAACAVRPENNRPIRRSSCPLSHPALLGHLYRPAGALDLRVRRAPLGRLLVPRRALGRLGHAQRRWRRAAARGIRAGRLHLGGRAGRDAGERARARVLRRRAPPELTFRSTAIRLDDGRIAVEGELTIKGITRAISAGGHYAAPRPSSFGEIAGLQLTRASTAASSASTGRWQLPARRRRGRLERRAGHRSAPQARRRKLKPSSERPSATSWRAASTDGCTGRRSRMPMTESARTT